jgi:hypothetical protein
VTTNSTFDGVDIATRDAVLTSTTTTANAALPKSGGALTGALTTNSTIDGRDVAADGVTADAALPKSGGAMTGDITRGGTVIQDGTITDTGDFTLDVAGDIILDAAGEDIIFKANGTTFGQITTSSGDLHILQPTSDKDILFRGLDGSTYINALTLDMENAGAATFNSTLTSSGSVRSLRSSGSTQYGDFGQDSSGGFITTHRPHASLYENFRFQSSNNSGTVERMRIDHDGNVAINTNNPSAYYSKSLVVSVPGEDGITVAGPTNGANYLMFADGTSGNARYRGFIGYNHTLDRMELATSGTAQMKIDSSGIVTKPYQPAFVAYNSTNAPFTVAGNAIYPFTSVQVNIGNHFNTTNKTFTAPVTGSYFLDFSTITTTTTANIHMEFKFSTGSPFGRNYHWSPTTQNWDSIQMSGVFYMAAGTTVLVFNHTNSVVVHGSTWNKFSGYLIG